MTPEDVRRDRADAVALNESVRSLLALLSGSAEDLAFKATGAWHVLVEDLRAEVRKSCNVIEDKGFIAVLRRS